VLRLTREEFSGPTLRRPGRFTVCFYAEWCPYSREFLEVFVAHEPQATVPLALADLSDQSDLRWELFGIEVVPTLIGFQDGRIVWRLDGSLGVGLLREDLAHAEEKWAEVRPSRPTASA